VRPVWAEIDLSAITHNLGELRRRAERPVKILAPVKANAYGHGVVEVAGHLARQGIDGFATANIEDAIAIREAGIGLPILLYGSQLPEGNEYLLRHRLTPSLTSKAGLEALAALAARHPEPVAVHVKVDAGFGRLGVRLDEAAAFVREVLAAPNLMLEGLYTHIPFSDEAGEAWSRRRMSAFCDLVREVEIANGIRIPYAQGAASSLVASAFEDPLNTISPGHFLYGLSPLARLDPSSLGLKPALAALRARVIHLGWQRRGDDVAGSGPAGLAADRKTGVILFGMDNGYRPAAPGKTAHVLCRGRRCAVLAVSAEYTVIDVSHLPDVAVGDVVTLIGADGGEHLTIEQLAADQGAPSAAYWLVGLKSVPVRYRSGEVGTPSAV
jgi:alanine racemase